MKLLLPILQQAFPNAVSYEPIAAPIIQANAEGHLVSVSFGDDNNAKTCFVKTVEALKYNETKSSWPDLRRTLMYLRTEVRFYKEVLPELLSANDGKSGVSTPELYAAGYDLDGILTEEEKATDDPTKGPLRVDWKDTCTANDQEQNSTPKGGYMVMEAISDEDYTQTSPISMAQAEEALETIATFHAAAWENKSLLQSASDRLSKGSYHLKTRNPKEVTGLPQAWTQFSAAFDIEVGAEEINLGQRLQDMAEYLCHELSPEPGDPYATLSHGDCKAMNCFLPLTTSAQERGAILLDFASTGVGMGMSDVAMLIHHAVRPEDLANGGEERLIDHYLDVLNQKLAPQSKTYPRDVANWHYQLAVADYFRFFLGRFWKTATPETFAKKKDSKNVALINRDVPAALRFLGRAQSIVGAIEAQRKLNI